MLYSANEDTSHIYLSNTATIIQWEPIVIMAECPFTVDGYHNASPSSRWTNSHNVYLHSYDSLEGSTTSAGSSSGPEGQWKSSC